MKERANPNLRFFDRFLGISIVFFLSLFKHKKRPLPQDIASIALLKTAGIGDTALLTGPILDLKKAYPKAQIILFTGTSNAAMGQFIPGISTIALPMTRPLKALKKVRKYPADILIDCDPWPRINALLAYFSCSLCTLGFLTPNQHRHALFDHPIPHQTTRHEIENYRALLAPLRIATGSPPTLFIPSQKQKKRVVLHIYPGGSRAYLKMWNEKKWLSLAEKLIKKGYALALTGSQKDHAPLNDLQEKMDSPFVQNYAGLALHKTVALLKSSEAVISVDTGIAHLAAILGCKTLVLHGPTAPARWGAIGPKVTHLTPPYTYWPCIQLGFEKNCTQNTCMQAISVAQVLKNLGETVQKKEGKNSPLSTAIL